MIRILKSGKNKAGQVLLKNSSLSISQIYEACGFETMTHFERIFKV